jgi:hypothetical protein
VRLHRISSNQVTRAGAAGLIACVIAIIVPLAIMSPASASAARADKTGTAWDAKYRSFFAGVRNKPAEAASVAQGPSKIVCTLSAPNPHWSHHKPGTVNFEPVTKCTYPVSDITMVSVIEDSLGRGEGEVCGRDHTAKENCPVALDCKKALYRGGVVSEITPPPGYVPRKLKLSALSNTVYEDCVH